jgi:hypothetical protein
MLEGLVEVKFCEDVEEGDMGMEEIGLEMGLEVNRLELEFEGDKVGDTGLDPRDELEGAYTVDEFGDPTREGASDEEGVAPKEWETAMAIVDGLVGEVDGVMRIFIVSMSMPSVARGLGNL